MIPLDEYLEEASKLPWRWGGGATGFEGHDCTIFVAGWAFARCGRDPGIGLRGSYSTEMEALGIIARAGGFPAFIDQQLRPCGWTRIAAEPRDGDIAVVLAPTVPDGHLKHVPAIRAGGLWVGRSPRGQVAKDFQAMAVWRYGDPMVRDLGPPAQVNHEGVIRSRSQQCAGGTMLQPSQHQQTGIIEIPILFGLTAIGVSGAALNFLVPVLAALVVTAITVGIQSLMVPKPPKPADGKAPKVQAIPPVIFGVGTSRVAGYFMLWEEADNRLLAVQALVGHRISAVNRYYLHDDIITSLDANGIVTGSNVDDGRYRDSKVRLESRLGHATETAYARHVELLGEQGIWTENHRGDGQASLGMVCAGTSSENFQKRFPYGAPQASAECDLALVWDFRDEEQNPADPETWGFSRNPALCLVWWLCFCEYGPKWDYSKAVLPVLERWQEEADICDEAIPRASGGSEPRYEVNGWATTETDPIAILNSFLASCDGHLAQHGDGTLVLTVGKFREELVETITDADIVGHFIQHDVPEEDEINRLVPRFTYPATDYSSAVTDYFESTTDQLKVGRVLSQEADLQWVHRWRQARRLAKREWLRIQEKKAGSFDLRLSAINAIHARWIRVQSAYRLPRLNDAIIENRRSVLALQQGGFQMEWKKHPAAIDDWNPEEDEGSVPPVPSRPNSEALGVPTIDSVSAVGNGTSVYIQVVIVEPSEVGVTPLVRYRVKDIGGETAGAWVEQQFADVAASLGLITLNTNPVPTNQLLEVEAAVRASGGTVSDWSLTVEVESIVDETAPGPVNNVLAVGDVGVANLSWMTPNSGNYHAAVVRRNTLDDEGTATLVRTEYGAPSASDAWSDTGLPAGNYYYWISSRNASGVESAAVATGVVTVVS